MQCFNFSEFCFVEATLQNIPSAPAWPKKKACFERGLLSPSGKCCIDSVTDWAPFLTCCSTRSLVHISLPWGDLSPWAQRAPSVAHPPGLQGLASSLSVKNICIHSSYSLSMTTLASAPGVIARFIQIQREQDNRSLRVLFPHGPMVHSAVGMAANAHHPGSD